MTYQQFNTEHYLKPNLDIVPPLGKKSVRVICPRCKLLVMTRVKEEISSTAYICCMLMIVIGCFFCSCVPLCLDRFRNRKHSCPSCNAFIGLYKPY